MRDLRQRKMAASSRWTWDDEKTLPTLFTFTRLVSRMNIYMSPQMSHVTKTPATVFAFIRLLSRMDSFV